MSPHHPQPEKRPEDDPFTPGDDLWEALGHAPKPEPDAWLATKTMARWRREQEEPESFWATWLQPLSLARVALAGGTLAAIGLAISLSFSTTTGPEQVTVAQSESAKTENHTVPEHPVEALLAVEEGDFEIFAVLPAPVDAVEPSDLTETTASGAPFDEALAYLADGQSGDVLFAEADWQ